LLFGFAYTNSVPAPRTDLLSTFTGQADAEGAEAVENVFEAHCGLQNVIEERKRNTTRKGPGNADSFIVKSYQF
jgi:hypothetical protein